MHQPRVVDLSSFRSCSALGVMCRPVDDLYPVKMSMFRRGVSRSAFDVERSVRDVAMSMFGVVDLYPVKIDGCGVRLEVAAKAGC